MANKTQVDALISTIKTSLSFFEKNLMTRAEWGEVNFAAASQDMERAKTILNYLQILPLDSLPDQAVNSINQSIANLNQTLTQIDNFKIAANNPVQARDSIQNTFHNNVDNFYTQSCNWVPFLAYQKGDVAQNINRLTEAVNQANGIIEAAKREVEDKRGEIDRIVTAAREASASAGAAVFTKDFEEESKSLEKSSTKWLNAAIGSALLTILVAVVMWVHAEKSPALSSLQVVQTIAAKLVILSIFVTAAVWCGRNYRALKHLATMNRHRALSLKTLRAFSAAASDDQTKNAVLMEVTRAVFQAGQTGYLENGTSSDESALKIVEIAKSFAPKQV